MSNVALNYSLLITGDSLNTGAGVISITFTGGTPPYTVTWVDPDLGSDYSIGGTSTRTGLFPGVYVINGIDSSTPNNYGYNNINVLVSSGICASILGLVDTTCGLNNGSVSATSTANLATTNFYLYTTSNSLVSSGYTNSGEFVFTSLSADSYYIVAEDIGGTSGSTPSFIISSSNELDFGFYSVPSSPCANTFTPIGKVYVTGQTGTPPYTYVWSNGDTGSTITGLTTGTYSVEVTDANGCKRTKSVGVGEVQPLGFTYFSAITPTCFSSDGSLTLNISGGTAPYYYSASTGNVLITYSQQFVLNNIPSGSYLFSVTDAGLCNIVVGTEISTPQSLGSVSLTIENSVCSSTGGSLLINVTEGSPPYTYQLIYPDSNSQIVTSIESNQFFNNLSAGTYSLFVTDETGCAYAQDVDIFTDNLFTISTLVSGTTCNGSNGAIELIKTSGGVEPFQYSLDGITYFSDTTLSSVTFTNITAGQHVVQVTDSSGCTQTAQVFVGNSIPLDFSIYSTGCGTGDSGTITAFISSGQPPFTYQWSDNVPNNPQQISVSGLTGGTYSVTITDLTGCYLTRQTTISCFSTYASYTTYVMGSEFLTTVSPCQFGLLQMLNDGYQDLIFGNSGCTFNSATFTAQVKVEPSGLSGQTTFFTTTQLNVAPSDNLYYDTITTLLYGVPGVTSVIVNPQTNQITIQTNGTNPALLNQSIVIDLVINYDISCLS
jgi:hypothetical protein